MRDNSSQSSNKRKAIVSKKVKKNVKRLVNKKTHKHPLNNNKRIKNKEIVVQSEDNIEDTGLESNLNSDDDAQQETILPEIHNESATNMDDTNMDDSSNEDDDEEQVVEPSKRASVKDDFSDFKKILVQELGPKMKNQIKKIEQDENQVTDDEQENVQNKKEPKKKSKSNKKNSNNYDAVIKYINSKIPELEPELIEELLKYDDNVLFVGNVPSSMDKRKIQQIFKRFGNIMSVRIRGLPGTKPIDKKLAGFKKTTDSTTKLVAYIVFESDDSVIKAIEGNQKYLQQYQFRVTKANQFEKKVLHKVVLRNLPSRTKFEETKNLVIQFLGDCGKVVRVKAFRNKPSDSHFSTALVFFNTADEVQLALRKNGQTMGKSTITVENYNEKVTLGFKRPATGSENTTNKPIHKKKMLKKQLKLAKKNANNAVKKVTYAKKQKKNI